MNNVRKGKMAEFFFLVSPKFNEQIHCLYLFVIIFYTIMPLFYLWYCSIFFKQSADNTTCHKDIPAIPYISQTEISTIQDINALC